MSTEVRQATLKLNTNRAAGPDRILAELVKCSLVEVYIYPRVIK